MALTLFNNDITGLGPKSTSQSNSMSNNNSNSMNYGGGYSDSLSSNRSNSSSFSGHDRGTRNSLLNAVMPTLTKSTSNMYDNADNYAQNAMGMYKSTANSLLKENMPKILDQLVAKGMMGGDVSEAAITNALTNLTKGAADQSYQAGMDAAQMKFNIPSLLNPILAQGQYSKGSTQGQSDSISNSVNSNYGESNSNSNSISSSQANSTNDLAPFELMERMFGRLMNG